MTENVKLLSKKLRNSLMGKQEYLDWINQTLKLELKRIEDLCTGAAYCQLAHILFPDSISLSLVEWKATSQQQNINNFTILDGCFSKLNVKKKIPIVKLSKGNFFENFDFLKWFKIFYDTIFTEYLPNYDPRAERDESSKSIEPNDAIFPVRQPIRIQDFLNYDAKADRGGSKPIEPKPNDAVFQVSRPTRIRSITPTLSLNRRDSSVERRFPSSNSNPDIPISCDTLPRRSSSRHGSKSSLDRFEPLRDFESSSSSSDEAPSMDAELTSKILLPIRTITPITVGKVPKFDLRILDPDDDTLKYEEPENSTSNLYNVPYKIGDAVIVAGKKGVVRYIGSTQFAKGIWAGVELDSPVGKNNGYVDCVKYFNCASKHGLFVPVSKLSSNLNIESEDKKQDIVLQGTLTELKDCLEIAQSSLFQAFELYDKARIEIEGLRESLEQEREYSLKIQKERDELKLSRTVVSEAEKNLQKDLRETTSLQAKEEIEMSREKQQLQVYKQLEGLLTLEDIKRLQNAIGLPNGIIERAGNGPIPFLNSVRNWEQFNPYTFDKALQTMGNQVLLKTARQLEWLSTPCQKLITPKKTNPTQTLVELLTNNLNSSEWINLTTSSCNVKVDGREDAGEMLKRCINNDVITKDMNDLSDSLEKMKRNDLADTVRNFAPIFELMSREKFQNEIHNVLDLDKNFGIEDCEKLLRKFMETNNKDVSVVFDEDAVAIESVYTPLTVIRVKPTEERVREENGLNEIDFLRQIHEQLRSESVEVVDIENIITTSNSTENRVWCLVGNPGSGKSFLCKHFAYLYGIRLLSNFQFVLSIPCRSEEWHKLEESRQKEGRAVNSEFIVNWLSLSMSTGARWSEYLSQHLARSDGKGLFVIIDGVDEFTNSVPFESTLLCQLLARRFLALSSVLVTSRPCAWSELHFIHGPRFTRFDDNFQVLGFTPENRDRYFAKRMKSVEKLNAVRQLFYLHDEINQLALIPVNASLFSALFNQSNSILTHTLSHLYTQLIVYIVRRQLSRMGLHEHSKVLHIYGFHPAIRECIQSIGLDANQGIFERELTSDKCIPLEIEGEEFECERLGLMQAHIKVDNFGVRVKVWTFQHLTIQEFMAALSICHNSWPHIGLIIRYFTTSAEYLSIYKMVIRFVSGILEHRAGFVTPILCLHALHSPLPLHEAPMIYQLYYLTELVEISNWPEFTQSFLFLCTIIVETNTYSEHFLYFKKNFQSPLCFYFQTVVSPNEWHCFLKSLQYINDFQVIHLQSDVIEAPQFQSLLAQLSSCSAKYLALLFIDEDFETINSFTSILSSATLPPDTKLSIAFQYCDLTNCPPLLFSSTNRYAGGLKIRESYFDQDLLEELTNKFSSLHNVSYTSVTNDFNWPILCQSIHRRVNTLYISDPGSNLSLKPEILTGLSSLTELYWATKEDCYKVLPFLLRNSSLTFLNLISSKRPSSNESYRRSLTQIISSNSSSLKEISLPRLHKLVESWASFFDVITPCSNLIVLQLYSTSLAPDSLSCWHQALKSLNKLILLALVRTPLRDTGMLMLCQSLVRHPAIRWLSVQYCELTSDSCIAITHLIYSLPTLKLLRLSGPELRSPDPEIGQILEDTAKKCSVQIEFED